MKSNLVMMSVYHGYYYNISNYSDSPEIRTKDLKDEMLEDVEKLLREISSPVRRVTHARSDLRCYWVSRANFAYVFTDFERPDEVRNVVGKGCNKLFERIKDEYYCLVLSQNLPHNMREINLSEDRKALVINIDYFRRFSTIISHENFVDLFLYRFDNPDIEKLIRAWVIESHERFSSMQHTYSVTVSEIASLIEQYKIRNLDELYELLRNGTNALKSKIEENYEFYNQELANFKTLMEKQKPDEKRFDLEDQLRDFIKKNPWIIDFTYDETSVEKDPGELVDALLVNSFLGYKKGLILELKLPAAKIIKRYRTTYSITAGVTDALSQIIDYVIKIQDREKAKLSEQTENGSWQRLFIDGMIIIGNDMTEYIEILNRYLHNIEIKTYRQIYDDAKKRLDMFAR